MDNVGELFTELRRETQKIEAQAEYLAREDPELLREMTLFLWTALKLVRQFNSRMHEQRSRRAARRPRCD